MASIEERKNNDGSISYRVQIRKKGIDMSKTFKDLETAKLFEWYKENLIDEMEAFEVPKSELFTLQDGYELKIKCMNEAGTYSSKYFLDLKRDYEAISAYIPKDTYLYKITFQDLDNLAKSLVQEILKVGGNQHDKTTGKDIQCSPRTAQRRLMCISSIYSILQQKGVNIKNPCAEYLPYFRKNYVDGASK